MVRRAGFMYGLRLPRDARGHVDTGLGKTVARGTIGLREPTDLVDHTPQEMLLDGVRFVFQYAPDSEAPAKLAFYLPDAKAFYGAEIVSHTLHNLCTLRGARCATRCAERLHRQAIGGSATSRWSSRAIAGGSGPRRVIDYRKAARYLPLRPRSDLRLANLGLTPRDRRGDRLPESLLSVWSQDAQGLMIRAVNGLHVADTLGQIIQSGYALANHYTLATGDVSTGAPMTTNYSLLRPNLGWQRTPQYFAFVLWSRFGGQMLPVTTTLNAATQLSAYAGRIDANTLSVLAINKSGEPIAARIDAPGAAAFTGSQADVAEADALMDTAVRFNGVVEAALADDLSNAPSQPVMATGGAITTPSRPTR